MRIDRLDLENFRNMESLSVLPCESVNIIYGDNAQGKTKPVGGCLALIRGKKLSRRKGCGSDPIWRKPHIDRVCFFLRRAAADI